VSDRISAISGSATKISAAAFCRAAVSMKFETDRFSAAAASAISR
jgi:hypothetical protein